MFFLGLNWDDLFSKMFAYFLSCYLHPAGIGQSYIVGLCPDYEEFQSQCELCYVGMQSGSLDYNVNEN